MMDNFENFEHLVEQPPNQDDDNYPMWLAQQFFSKTNPVEDLLEQAPNQDDDNYPSWLAEQLFKQTTSTTKTPTTTSTSTATAASNSTGSVSTGSITAATTRGNRKRKVPSNGEASAKLKAHIQHFAEEQEKGDKKCEAKKLKKCEAKEDNLPEENKSEEKKEEAKEEKRGDISIMIIKITRRY